MNADIETLTQMKIGDIRDLEKMQKDFNNKCGDIIDRQKETVAAFIEQNKLEKKDWAEKFMEDLNEIN